LVVQLQAGEAETRTTTVTGSSMAGSVRVCLP